jgi:uncharacterized protein
MAPGVSFAVRYYGAAAFLSMSKPFASMDIGVAIGDLCAKKMKNEMLVPPFSAETAAEKLQLNEDVWNTRDAGKVSLLYTDDVEWSDRTTFLHDREAVRVYLAGKFAAQRDYAIRKELWGAKENRNAVRFQEEWRDVGGQWFHSYGNEQLEFDEKGYIRKRFGCISDMVIDEGQRSL